MFDSFFLLHLLHMSYKSWPALSQLSLSLAEKETSCAGCANEQAAGHRTPIMVVIE